MPNIPSYQRRITPKPVGKAPIPLAAADVGAGAVGRGLQRFGRGISNIAKSIFQIEQDKQVIRDNASLASANGDYNKAVADKINEAKRTTFTSIEQFIDFRKQAELDLDAIVKSSIGKMSSRAGQSFSNFAKSNKQNSLRQIEGIVWQKEIEFGQSDTLRQYSNKFEVLAGAGVSVEDILKDPSLDIIETGMSPYWKTGELLKVRDRTLIDALVNVGRYEDARELAKSTTTFTSTERLAANNHIEAQEAKAKREAATKFKLLQEATNRQMLADYWDGILEDPQKVTNAFRAGYLSDTDAKNLREAMLNPEPAKLNLKSLATVKQAIEEIGTNTKTVPQALSVLYAHLDSIDPITGKSLLNEIYTEQEKNKSEMKRESRALMEELIRDRDKFTGMFTDDERQILASAEAYLMLDTEIQKAVEAKKPLERRDIMIKAIQIGRQMKAKIKQEEADAIPPGFEPETEGYPIVPRAPDYTAKGKLITKGALAKPDFVLTSEGEPEKVFDSKGREIGLRRKSGAVFGIGYIAVFNGKKYEYTGNGNWKLVE